MPTNFFPGGVIEDFLCVWIKNLVNKTDLQEGAQHNGLVSTVWAEGLVSNSDFAID